MQGRSWRGEVTAERCPGAERQSATAGFFVRNSSVTASSQLTLSLH